MYEHYRSDPLWQQVRREYIDDARDGENDDDVFVRRIEAAVELRRIEKVYANRPAGRST